MILWLSLRSVNLKQGVGNDSIAKSYASVTLGMGNIPIATPASSLNVVVPSLSDSSAVFKKGNNISAKLNQQAFQERLNLCKFSLIARLILAKGDTPWKLASLKLKLSSLWGLANWRLIFLSSGYYHVLFRSAEDTNLKLGVLRLQKWTPDFNPSHQKSTNAQDSLL